MIIICHRLISSLSQLVPYFIDRYSCRCVDVLNPPPIRTVSSLMSRCSIVNNYVICNNNDLRRFYDSAPVDPNYSLHLYFPTSDSIPPSFSPFFAPSIVVSSHSSNSSLVD